jgi:catechol 2,3-dioxygenase-like lactoylglutathione lyase family enzyme
MHPQPLIAVRDVLASRGWYQHLLGCKNGHGGTEYEQILDPRGTLILQLHDGDAREHSPLGDPSARPRGNGVLLWFQVEDSDAAVERARTSSTEILEGPKAKPNANHLEIWVRDPDGYTVVLAGARGDA